MTNEGTPAALRLSAGLGPLRPEREAFDLHDCATGYAYTEATDPAAPDDWTTDDVVKAFIAGYEMAKRQLGAGMAVEHERTAAALRACAIAQQCIKAAGEDRWASFDALSDDFDDALAAVAEAGGPNVQGKAETTALGG